MNISHIADEFVNSQIITELESLKAKINEKDRAWMPKSFVNKIFDNRIAELKGETDEQRAIK